MLDYVRLGQVSSAYFRYVRLCYVMFL